MGLEFWLLSRSAVFSGLVAGDVLVLRSFFRPSPHPAWVQLARVSPVVGISFHLCLVRSGCGRAWVCVCLRPRFQFSQFSSEWSCWARWSSSGLSALCFYVANVLLPVPGRDRRRDVWGR